MDTREDIIHGFIKATREEEVLDAAVSGVSALTTADEAFIAMVDGDALVVRAGSGSQYDAARTLQLDDTPYHRVLDSGESLVIDDLTDPPNPSDNSLADSFPDAESLLITPIGTVGILLAAGTPEGCFDADDRALAVQTAGFAAAAIERIRGAPESTIGSEEYASILSHDLRNPLLVAEGYLQLARESHDTEHFDRVESALDRINELIEQMATLARTGQRIDDPTPVDFEQSVRDAWDHVVTADTTLEVTLPETRIIADKAGLTQLLENVFANAVEHAGAGVTVRVGLTDDGFYVEDTGDGIPPDDRDKVFNHEYSSSDDQPGIGLSIVEQLANAHGWTVRATESPEGGARFEFTGVELDPPSDP